MNTYEIKVNNATMVNQALNEWSAMKDLGIFKGIGNIIDFVRTSEPESRNGAWIYQVELNGQLTLPYVKRIA